jgi:hypothetical protein
MLIHTIILEFINSLGIEVGECSPSSFPNVMGGIKGLSPCFIDSSHFFIGIQLWRKASWLWMTSASYVNSFCFSTSMLCLSHYIAAKYLIGPSRFGWYFRQMISPTMAQ